MRPDHPAASTRGHRLVAEAIGTFFLVLIGPGTVMVDAFSGGAVGHVGVALAFAFVVIAMIYALGHLSGAHINPAVTVAFWSVRRFSAAEVIPYVGAQCIGAATGSFVLHAVLGPFGPALVGDVWRAHWVYWLSPLTAMIAAAHLYDRLREAEPPPSADKVTPLGTQGPIVEDGAEVER